MKKTYLILLWMCHCIICSASDKSTLHKYHQLSLLPHSGQVDLYIDLYQLSDPDFDFKIGLQYVSDGFRPLTYSGATGDNWNLVAAGYITRQIIGVADDRFFEYNITSPSGNTYTEHSEKGLLVLLRDSSYSQQTNESIYAGNWDDTSAWNNIPFSTPTNYLDVQSDIYTFNFQGYHGEFMIGLDGNVDILSGDFVSVDLSNMSTQIKGEPYYQHSVSAFPMNEEPLESIITIKTLDGYTYVFGGNSNAIGYTLPFSQNIQAPDITTWMLTQIIAPNQREIRFHYKSPTATDSLKLFAFHTSVQIDTDDNQSDYFLSDTMHINPFVNNNLSAFHTYNAAYSLEKQILLDSVTTSDNSFRIVFAYKSLPNTIYSADNYSSEVENETIYRDYWSADKYFLSNIKVYNTNQLLSNWELTYHSPVISHSAHNYHRQYLQSLRHTLANLVYHFDYDFTNSNNITTVNNLDSVDLSGYFRPNPKLGTLTTIQDPLGKITQLEYAISRHDSVRLIKQLGTEYTSIVTACTNRSIINAVTISSIKNHDHLGALLSYKRYSYGDLPDDWQSRSIDNSNMGNTMGALGTSSGILNIDFAIDISDALNQSWNEGKTYLITPYIAPTGSKNVTIEYDKVKEYEYNVHTNTILYQNIFFYDKTDDLIVATPNCKHQLLQAYSYISQRNRRKSLLLREEYTGTQLLSQHMYNYEPIISHQTRWNVGRYGTYAYKIFIPQLHPIQERAVVHESSGIYDIQTTYVRDTKHRVIQEIVSQNELTRFACYTYPDQLFEYNPSHHSFYAMGYKGLVNRNEIDKPVETIQGFIRNGNSYITSGSLHLYQAYNWSGAGQGGILPPIDLPDGPIMRSNSLLDLPEYYAPVASYSLILDAPIPLNEFSGIRIEDNNVIFDQHYDTIATYRYNKYLRLTKQTIAGITTNYVWDDKKICITEQSTGSQITQYTHIPYVGVSSITSPRGITTYYSYDILGNVIEVYQMHDNKKVILQSNLFHYQSQQ